MNTSRRLARSTTDRIIGGVAGGIANYLNIDPTLVRLGFVLLVLVGGVSPLIYLVLWAVLPSENTLGQPFSQQIRANVSEMEQRATSVAQTIGDRVGQFTNTSPAPTVNSSQQSTGSTQSQQDQGPSIGPTTRL